MADASGEIFLGNFGLIINIVRDHRIGFLKTTQLDHHQANFSVWQAGYRSGQQVIGDHVAVNWICSD